ncbi:MAG: TIGR00282 family metallophosphoesterase [bacterium]
MRLCFIGDVVGRAGRGAVRTLLPGLRDEWGVDFFIANGENASGGIGLTPQNARELLDAGIHVITSGNHIWDKKEILKTLDEEPRILRPANYPPGVPGRGAIVSRVGGLKVGVMNISGRVWIANLDCPFRVARREAQSLAEETGIIIVDMHAEATSEKMALGWYLDGLVSAVIGTHTHVQTADERILPGGTAYITDAGMTGAMDSIIGMRKDIVIDRFLYQIPKRYEAARKDAWLCGVIVDIDDGTGRARGIRRIRLGAGASPEEREDGGEG